MFECFAHEDVHIAVCEYWREILAGTNGGSWRENPDGVVLFFIIRREEICDAADEIWREHCFGVLSIVAHFRLGHGGGVNQLKRTDLWGNPRGV